MVNPMHGQLGNGNGFESFAQLQMELGQSDQD